MNQNHKKIERLLLFSELAKHLSFTTAAEKLSISKSYLSEQIKRLEQQLNVPLLVRSTRNMRLTDAGQKLLIGMERLEGDILGIERSIFEAHSGLMGTVRITCPNQFAEAHLLKICAAFREEHPDVNFHIDCSYTNHNLSQQNFDLAFRATHNPPENMVAKRLCDYSYWTCAAPSYLDRYPKIQKIQDIQDHFCIHRHGQKYWEYKSGSVPIKTWLAINDNALLKNEALAGNGLIRVPDYFVAQEIFDGKLVKLLADEYIPCGVIHLVYPQMITHAARVREFISFTVHWFEGRQVRPSEGLPL